MCVLLLALTLPVLLAAQGAPQPPRSLVFTHVTLIDMTGSRPQPEMTVVVTGERIAALGRTGEVALPAQARVVEAGGKFLLPGLWDMHAHTVYERAEDTERTLLPLLVANGITGIRDMGSMNSLAQLNGLRKKALAEGGPLVPRIVLGQQVDGYGGDEVPFVYRVRNAAEASAAVQRIKREGFDFVKVYSRLSREEYFAVAEEAKRLGLPFGGHVPPAVGDADASDAGQNSIEHLDGILFSASSHEESLRARWMEYESKVNTLKGKPAPPELDALQFSLLAEGIETYDAQKAARLYARFARNKTYQCPTLVIHQAWGSLSRPTFFDDPRMRYVPRRQQGSIRTYTEAARSWPAERKAIAERLFRLRLRMVSEMQRAGVELLAGTDIGPGYPVAGFALHDELGLLVQAGLTPMEALRTATYNPAQYLGLLGSLGTIERGKIADLLLLDANPLDDIGNTRKINAVVIEGRYLPQETLQRTLSEIERAVSRN